MPPVGAHLLLLLLASGEPGDRVPAARAELEGCAERIEALKARGARGAELERLLRRAQELAVELELERSGAAARATAEGPAPEELRERADAARDEADRLAAEIAALDVRIQDGRRASGDSGVARAALTTGAVAPATDRLRALQAERAALSARRARAEAEAARLDAEARDADRVR